VNDNNNEDKNVKEQASISWPSVFRQEASTPENEKRIDKS